MFRIPLRRTSRDTAPWTLLVLAAGISTTLYPFVIGCAGPTEPTPLAATPQERWRQDLHFLAANLKKLHKEPFHRCKPGDFDQVVESLDRSIDSLEEHQIIVGLMRLTNMIGDAHTRLLWREHVGFGRYPLELRWFADGLYVIGAAREYERALGCRLEGINGHKLRLACTVLSAVVPAENEQGFREAAPDFMVVPEILHALGLSPSRDQARFALEDPDGQPLVLDLRSQRRGATANWARLPGPLYLREARRFYRFEYLPDSKTLYCQYNICANQKDEPLAQFVERMFRFVDEHPVDRFVLDLRNNGGGDSSVAAPLIARLKSHDTLNRRGRFFVIVGRGTFSSAAMNAVELRQRTEAILVGEPTAQKPNHFGEVRSFRLPHSGLTVEYSTKYFQLVDGDAPSIMPDVCVAMTFAQYLAGRDPALDAILEMAIE
ncbi:MAG: hypothetical protein JSU68_01275 [Phycisphaerales bacterium]|nr:MAG: hypothetical protein JSU68_01275 [Phycisphaerales bacterium]